MKYNIEDFEVGERVFVSTLHTPPSEIYVITSIYLETDFIVIGLLEKPIDGIRRIRVSRSDIIKLDSIDEDLNILNEI